MCSRLNGRRVNVSLCTETRKSKIASGAMTGPVTGPVGDGCAGSRASCLAHSRSRIPDSTKRPTADKPTSHASHASQASWPPNRIPGDCCRVPVESCVDPNPFFSRFCSFSFPCSFPSLRSRRMSGGNVLVVSCGLCVVVPDSFGALSVQTRLGQIQAWQNTDHRRHWRAASARTSLASLNCCLYGLA